MTCIDNVFFNLKLQVEREKLQKPEGKTNRSKPLIEELPESSSKENSEVNSNTRVNPPLDITESQFNTGNAESEKLQLGSVLTEDEIKKCGNENKNISELDMAFKELCDPLVPVRGHGLIRLTHLIKKRDTCIKSRERVLLKIFEENLDHGDSYIYLSAINGLSAMCDMDPDVTVPRVCQLYADFHGSVNKGKDSSKRKSAELRMKLGEVIVKAARSLGKFLYDCV